MERILNWTVAFCIGYVIGVGIAALVIFGGR
jgi:hypothetical protein